MLSTPSQKTSSSLVIALHLGCIWPLQQSCLETFDLKHAVYLQILGALHTIHAVAVFFKFMSPALYSPGVGRKYTLVILNSLNLAVACRSANALLLPATTARAAAPISAVLKRIMLSCLHALKSSGMSWHL